jgi:hypothetical protein
MVTYRRLRISRCESGEPTKILVGNRHVENLRPQSQEALFSLVLVGGGSVPQKRLQVRGTHPFQAEDGIGRESGKVVEKFRKVRRRYFPTRRLNNLWQFGLGFISFTIRVVGLNLFASAVVVGSQVTGRAFGLPQPLVKILGNQRQLVRKSVESS